MKKTLEVKVIGEGYFDFRIIDKLPENGNTFNGEEVTGVEKFETYCRFSIPDGVFGYELYTIKTIGEWYNAEYHVAIETSIPMENFIENLLDNLEEEPHEIDIDEAKQDVDNFRKQDGWYLPEDLTPETYMKAWNSYVRKHGDLDDNQ